jgi:hypothetical protein
VIEFFLVFVLHGVGRITVSEPMQNAQKCVEMAEQNNLHHEWMKDPRAKEFNARFECAQLLKVKAL